MAVTVYRSTDVGAPVLTGLPGTLIALLDAILVNGYGALPAAGWTKPFNGQNGAVYRNNSVSGSGMYLNVDDNGMGVNGHREARVRGFEQKTGYDRGNEQASGFGPFPTITQLPAGILVSQSRSLDATARKWVAVADSRTFYFFTFPGQWQGYSAFMFGDFFSLTNDPYRCAIIGREAENLLETNERLSNLHAATAVGAGHYTPRTIINDLVAQSSVQFGKHGNATHSATALIGSALYPNLTDGMPLVWPIHLHELAPPSGTVAIRGRLRGLVHWLHPIVASDGDIINGTGQLAGKQYLVIRPSADRSSIYMIEISDTWETN
jgi:hypothetical protein